MKTQHFILLFAVLATATLCQDALQGVSGGYYVRTNNNSNCIYQFLHFLATDGLTIGQQYKTQTVAAPSPVPAGCIVPGFSFTSFFAGETLPADDKLPLLAPTDPSNPVYTSKLNATWLYRNNGTGCVLLPQTSRSGLAQYLCSLDYAGTPLYYAVWGTGNFTFNNIDGSFNAFIPNKQLARITGASTLVYTLNTSFPNITANLYSSCTSNSNIITALSTLVTVSTAANLTDALSGWWLAYVLVKKNSSTASGDYIVKAFTSKAPLFTPSSNTNGCWSMGVNYQDFLPDIGYCASGCKVSFVLKDNNGNVYDLKTNGVSTSDGSVGGGSGGSGNGGNGGNGGNNGGNGGNGGVVSSANTMAINAALLLISAAYLAWF